MLISRVRRATESFWVLPAALGIGAVLLAELLLTLDRHVVGDTQVWVFSDLSATGSRSLLTTVGGSMLGVAATSFSITISVLATTSSTYGPRLVRNFMADRGNQLVLAVLTSSFVYCLVVLRAVRSEADGVGDFVPTVSVHVAVLIALLDVAVLVYFIHHIATSVQVTSLQQRVGRELDAVVELLYPAPVPDDRTRDLPLPSGARAGPWSVHRARATSRTSASTRSCAGPTAPVPSWRSWRSRAPTSSRVSRWPAPVPVPTTTRARRWRPRSASARPGPRTRTSSTPSSSSPRWPCGRCRPAPTTPTPRSGPCRPWLPA